MKSRTLAIAGTIAALSLAAAPIAGAASTTHHKATEKTSLDTSRDVRHVEKSKDSSSVDRSTDRSVDRGSSSSKDVRDR